MSSTNFLAIINKLDVHRLDMSIVLFRTPIRWVVRKAVLERARHCCEDCRASAPLELHHIRYHKNNGAGDYLIFGDETPDDLVALCRQCHRARHIDLNGDFWEDPEEMENHWSAYWNEIEKD